MPKSNTKTMTASALTEAVNSSDAIYIGVRLKPDGEVHYMKWRDKSEALRKRVRKMISVASGGKSDEVFCASVEQAAGESVVIIGDHIGA